MKRKNKTKKSNKKFVQIIFIKGSLILFREIAENSVTFMLSKLSKFI